MAINRNLMWDTTGSGRAADDNGGATKPPAGTRGAGAGARSASTAFASAPFIEMPGMSFPTEQPAAPSVGATAPFLGAIATAPSLAGRNFGTTGPFIPPIWEIPPGIFIRPEVNKTTTQIAQGAMSQLRAADPAVVREAVSTIKNKNIAAGDLLNYLERRTRVGEVLNELAKDWTDQTVRDFAEAFQMPATTEKLPVMDSIVSVAILNDPDLKNELQAENTIDASQGDLLENRRIVWQWPQPGTPFTPPYLIMVAVERQDTAQAQNIIQSILGDLVDFQGYKIPSAAKQKIG